MGGKFPSLILWGPSRYGEKPRGEIAGDKAALIFVQLSAVFSGVKECGRDLRRKGSATHGDLRSFSWTKSIVSTIASRRSFAGS